jgi:hypothetical protein
MRWNGVGGSPSIAEEIDLSGEYKCDLILAFFGNVFA